MSEFNQAHTVYKGIKYFELHPITTNKKLIITLDDTVETINKKLKGIMSKDIKIKLSDDLYYEAKAIKTDIELKTNFEVDNWNELNEYRYSIIQFKGHDTISLIVIKGVEDGKVVTQDGEISIQDIRINTTLSGISSAGCLIDNRILEGMRVSLIGNLLCFIKQ